MEQKEQREPVSSFVVRVYRVEQAPARTLVGVVEGPGLTGQKAFRNVDELWEIVRETSKQG